MDKAMVQPTEDDRLLAPHNGFHKPTAHLVVTMHSSSSSDRRSAKKAVSWDTRAGSGEILREPAALQDLQTVLLRIAAVHTFFAVISTFQWSVVGTTYAAMCFSVWEWISGFSIFSIGSRRDLMESIDYRRLASLCELGQKVVRTFAVMAVIASFFAFASFCNGVYTVVRISAPLPADEYLTEEESIDYQIITLWFLVIGSLNIALGVVATPVQLYIAAKLYSVLK